MKKIIFFISLILVIGSIIAYNFYSKNLIKLEANNKPKSTVVKNKTLTHPSDNKKNLTTSKVDESKTNASVQNKVDESKTDAVVQNKVDESKTNAGVQNKVNENIPNTDVQNKINKVIVIDPGHATRSNLEKEPLAPNSSEMKIKDGGGAEGIVTKNPEYLINMQVSLKLKELLEKKGYTVKMTKTDNSESLGNVQRAEIWNSDNADLVIRIHADSSDNSSIKGASMLVPEAINDNTKAIYDKSKEYGQVVLNTVTKEVGMENRGVVERNDMTGFNWSKDPVILIEMGFLSNAEEDRLLGTDEYQNKIALSLADGISEAVK